MFAQLTGRRDHILAFSTSGKYFAAASTEYVTVWEDWEKEKRRAVMRVPAERSIAFSADEKYIATGGRLWEIRSGLEIVQVRHKERIAATAFSPEGTRLVTGGGDDTVRFWLWQPNRLLSETCQRLYRNLTTAEWSQHVGVEQWLRTCPDLKGGDN